MKTDNTELFEHMPVSKAVSDDGCDTGNAAFCHAYGNCKFIWNRGFQPDFMESWNQRPGESEEMCCFQHKKRRFLFIWCRGVSDTSGYFPVALAGAVLLFVCAVPVV